MYDYQQNFSQESATRQTTIYNKLVAQWAALLLASDEGVFEVTIRSQSGPVTIAVCLNDGTEIAQLLAENFGKRIARLEHNLNTTLGEIGLEVRADLQAAQRQEVQRDAESAQRRAEWDAYTRTLAEQQGKALAALAREQASQRGTARRARVAPAAMSKAAKQAAAGPMNAAVEVPTAKVGEGPQS
ncbi:hypothetical protein BEN47_06165 [Hymenobacter lapidarius]|uniref:Uncharacterized protein n=1 Tax=Hymenobacter lapidarius TaxID=1908237 RepID=A0A1G1SQD7_9BACT|nr:hypothetical protein [Hymenobacter lapidarius]OGX80839.1 hypothetical protein BEN47_06165 [Hymenobacter lapidarius]